MTLLRFASRICASIILFSVGLHNLYAADFAVSPMLIEMEGVERSTHEFVFTIHGKSDANIKLDLFDMSQLETGYMGFTEARPDSETSMASWIELEDTQLEIREGENTEVRGRLQVPSRAAGTFLAGIMVEEDIPEEDLSGIDIRVRYAVIVNMRVAGTANRRIKTDFRELAVVEREDGVYFQGYFNNLSSQDNWLESQVQIRDSNNRLVERVEMKTESAWQRNDPASRVFPGAKVRLYGKMSRPVAAADYKVLVRNRFAEKSQPVYRDTVHIAATATASTEKQEKQKSQPPANSEIASVTPGVLAVDVRPNGTSFTPFFISNNSNEDIRIDLPAALEDAKNNGIAGFEFYPATVEVRPGAKSRIVLKQSHMPEKAYNGATFEAAITSINGSGSQTLQIVTAGGSE